MPCVLASIVFREDERKFWDTLLSLRSYVTLADDISGVCVTFASKYDPNRLCIRYIYILYSNPNDCWDHT